MQAALAPSAHTELSCSACFSSHLEAVVSASWCQSTLTEQGHTQWAYLPASEHLFGALPK